MLWPPFSVTWAKSLQLVHARLGCEGPGGWVLLVAEHWLEFSSLDKVIHFISDGTSVGVLPFCELFCLIFDSINHE